MNLALSLQYLVDLKAQISSILTSAEASKLQDFVSDLFLRVITTCKLDVSMQIELHACQLAKD